MRRPDPIDDELQRRLRETAADARRALGRAAPNGVVGLQTVQELTVEIESALSAFPDAAGWSQASAAHTAQLDRLRRRYETRFQALEDIHVAVGRLREMTAPRTILASAPAELCEHSRLHRAVVSVIRDGHLVAEAAFFRDDAAGAQNALAALAADPPRLEHPLRETDIVRRPRATIVTEVQADPRAHRPTALTMAWRTYAAAPIRVRGEVIGVMHADAGATGRALNVLDGDVLWAFTSGLAGVYEAASLRRSLRRHRTEMRDFVEWLTTRSAELSDAPMELAFEPDDPSDPPGQLDVIATAAQSDDRLVFENLLTRRELDVLRLLARGETNGGIAAQLVISEATVKFHVLNLLRKLHVKNRAEAAARYHRLVQRGPDQTSPI